MNIKLFSKIVKKLGNTSLEDFECTYDGKIYGFKDIGDDKWDDEGKYQYKTEQGQLIEMNDKYKEIQAFGVSRSIQRSGSYFTEYNYDYEPYEFYQIKQVLIPEKIILAHTESKWNELKIDLKNVVDEEEEERKRLEAEKIKLEEEAKAEKERLAKLYSMNNRDIIQKVYKNFKKRKVEKFSIIDMRKEYFDIVVKENLESQEWIDYHRSLQTQ